MGRGGALWSEWSEFRWTSLFESNIGSTFILSWTITRRCLRVIHTAYKWVHKGIMLIHMSYIVRNTHCRRRNISLLEWTPLSTGSESASEWIYFRGGRGRAYDVGMRGGLLWYATIVRLVAFC